MEGKWKAKSPKKNKYNLVNDNLSTKMNHLHAWEQYKDIKQYGWSDSNSKVNSCSQVKLIKA